MRTEVKRILRNLECEKGHSIGSRKIVQKVFYGPDNERLFFTTPHGALDNVRCWCGSLPKDPNA